MFCPKCGNQIEDTAAFCDKCGTKLGVAQTTQENPSVNVQVQELSKRNRKFKIWMIPPIAVVAAVIFIIIIMPMLNSKSKLSVKDVKDSYLDSFEQKTIGEAFEDYFDNASWKSFETEEGVGVVEFNGDFQYPAYGLTLDSAEVYYTTTATVQFTNDPDMDDDYFYVYGVWFRVIDTNADEWMKKDYHLEDDLPKMFIQAIYENSEYPYWVFGA